MYVCICISRKGFVRRTHHSYLVYAINAPSSCLAKAKEAKIFPSYFYFNYRRDLISRSCAPFSLPSLISRGPNFLRLRRSYSNIGLFHEAVGSLDNAWPAFRYKRSPPGYYTMLYTFSSSLSAVNAFGRPIFIWQKMLCRPSGVDDDASLDGLIFRIGLCWG